MHLNGMKILNKKNKKKKKNNLILITHILKFIYYFKRIIEDL